MAELPFQFHPREVDLQVLLRSAIAGDEGALDSYFRLMERRDRDLEDFLKTLGRGGTSASLLSTCTFGGNMPVSGSSTVNIASSPAISVPTDTSFNYYVDWHINGQMRLFNTPEGSVGFGIQGYAQIREQGPGAGYESWGFICDSPNNFDGTGVFVHGPTLSGHGNRMELVSPVLLGTDVHVDATFITSASSSSASGGGSLFCTANLFAIPV